VLSIAGFSALLAAIIEGPERGWSDSLVVAGFVIAVVCLVGFVLYERRATEPMLDMKFFHNRRFAMGSMGITVTFFAMFSLFFLLTQYLQYVKGYSPLSAGLRGLPFAVTMIAVSPRAPLISARFGAKRAVAGGLASLVLGLLLMSRIELDTSYWYVAGCLVLAAYGVASSMPSLSSGIVQSVPLHKAGVGSAVNDTTREVGGAIGIAVIGSIVNSIYRSHVGGAITQLPPALQALAKDNIAKALAISDTLDQQVGAGASAQMRTAVQQAFVDGTHVALRLSAAVVAIGAVILYVRLPDSGEHHTHSH
jgi:Na+/melibiose symporter-like transporter